MNQLQKDLRELGDAGDYKQQGALFLQNTSTTFEVIEAVPQKKPSWEHYGINYSVTLKNPRGSYTFDFWGSQRDKEMLALAEKSNCNLKLETFLKDNGYGIGIARIDKNRLVEKTRNAIKPTAYDVLACLRPMSSDTFEDFCAEYGYDEDSRTAEKTYHALVAQDRMMRKLFTHEELEALGEIN